MIPLIILTIVVSIVFVLLGISITDHDKYKFHGQALIDKSTITSKSAVMFDIDNTLINIHGGIQPIIELCHYAKSKNIKIILITARPDLSYIKLITHRQLKKHNIPCDELYFCSPSQKKNLKQHIAYDFIFSVGDLDTDVDGDHSGVPIKLN